MYNNNNNLKIRTRLLGLINEVQHIVHRSITHTKKRRRRRRKKNDAIVHTVKREREKGQRKKKRCRDRCQVNDLEHILSEKKKKKNLLMIECLKCVTAALIIGQFIYICICTHMASMYSIKVNSSSLDFSFFFCYIITLLKNQLGFNSNDYVIHTSCLSLAVCILSRKEKRLTSKLSVVFIP
jgi:hypothetical protein